jgi:hypothetical protein
LSVLLPRVLLMVLALIAAVASLVCAFVAGVFLAVSHRGMDDRGRLGPQLPIRFRRPWSHSEADDKTTRNAISLVLRVKRDVGVLGVRRAWRPASQIRSSVSAVVHLGRIAMRKIATTDRDHQNALEDIVFILRPEVITIGSTRLITMNSWLGAALRTQ